MAESVIRSIARMPRVIDRIPEGARGVHESVLRAYHILERVKGMLDDGVPSATVRWIIAEMEHSDGE